MTSPLTSRPDKRNTGLRKLRSSKFLSGLMPSASSPKLPSLSRTLHSPRMSSPPPVLAVLAATDRPRLSLNSFALSRTIGTGTFARVRLARRKDTCEVVALKIMNKADIVRKRQVEHVRNERNLLSSLNCPFIVSLKDAFQDKENLYLVEEFVQGGELYSLIRKKKCFTGREASFFAAEIACAFSYLHARHIVYRDLKPENVLLTVKGHAKLADFGFAKTLERNGRTFTLCGTPEYLAPEVIRQTGHSYPYDWWCLGVILYEMMVGHTPFTDKNPFKLYEKIVSHSVVFPPSCDPRCKSLISKLMEKDPGDRLVESQVFAHEFFRDVDWGKARVGELEPPFTMEARGEEDARNFDEYPEEKRKVGEKLPVSANLFSNYG